jgi:hypothetical protein
MITTIEGEKEGEREIKRTHEPRVLCYFKSTTLVLPLIVEDWDNFDFTSITFFLTITKSISLVSLQAWP